MTRIAERARALTPKRAVALLGERIPDLRGCALLREGRVLAATGERRPWGRAARSLLEATDRADSAAAEHVHVATEDGEAFAVRRGDLAMVVVTERFTLASLVVFEMRALLRELEKGS